MRVVIDHEPATGTHLVEEHRDRLVRIRRMLDDAETEHHVVLTRGEGQTQHICLHHAMSIILREILLIRLDRAAQVDGCHPGAGSEQDFGESSRAATRLEHLTAGMILQECPRLRADAAPGAPQRDIGPAIRIELGLAEGFPLEAERIRIVPPVAKHPRDPSLGHPFVPLRTQQFCGAAGAPGIPAGDQCLPINGANDIRKHGHGRLAPRSVRIASSKCAVRLLQRARSPNRCVHGLSAYGLRLVCDALPVGIDADLGPFALRIHTRLVGNDPAALRDRLHAGHFPLPCRRAKRITDGGGHIDELHLLLHFDDRPA